MPAVVTVAELEAAEGAGTMVLVNLTILTLDPVVAEVVYFRVMAVLVAVVVEILQVKLVAEQTMQVVAVELVTAQEVAAGELLAVHVVLMVVQVENRLIQTTIHLT